MAASYSIAGSHCKNKTRKIAQDRTSLQQSLEKTSRTVALVHPNSRRSRIAEARRAITRHSFSTDQAHDGAAHPPLFLSIHKKYLQKYMQREGKTNMHDLMHERRLEPKIRQVLTTQAPISTQLSLSSSLHTRRRACIGQNKHLEPDTSYTTLKHNNHDHEDSYIPISETISAHPAQQRSAHLLHGSIDTPKRFRVFRVSRSTLSTSASWRAFGLFAWTC